MNDIVTVWLNTFSFDLGSAAYWSRWDEPDDIDLDAIVAAQELGVLLK